MIKVGIIGMGIRGKLFAQAAVINNKTKLVSICDNNEEALKSAMHEFSVNGYSNYPDMLSKESLDLVCITTPDFSHKDIVVTAAKQGVGIFLEKPMATSLEDCIAMEEAIKSNGVPFTVAYTNRWNPPYKRAKEIIDSGELGEIIAINARLNDTIAIPTNMLRWSAKSSPGWFLMTHPLDLALWYTKKKVCSVYATGIKKVLLSKGYNTYDYIHAIVTFEDGTDAILESCWILPNGLPKPVDYKFQIIGTKGVINVDTQDQMIHFINEERMEYPDTLMVNLYGRIFGHNLICFDSFIDSIEQKTDPVVKLIEAKHNVAVIDAIHKSLLTKKLIEINY